MLRRWMAALAGAVLACVVMVSGAAAQPAGEVLAFHGQCFIETGKARSALKQGDPVQVGDTVVVPKGARLKLRMSDGSIIAAASGSRLTIGAYGTGAGGRRVKLDLAAGLLRAVVAAVSGPSRFEVDTATGVAAVRSTDWFVAAKPGMTQVGVLSGVVSLESRATGHAVDIPARWGARVEAGMDPVPPRVWRDSEFEDVIARTTVD
ncbi:MAG TPA: FecR domain-containing protein [Stellaceae bacterium]|nr:FecR domain-containing protein [Stellaceae bacterium]